MNRGVRTSRLREELDFRHLQEDTLLGIQATASVLTHRLPAHGGSGSSLWATVEANTTKVAGLGWAGVSPAGGSSLLAKAELLCFGLNRQDPRKSLEPSILKSVREFSFYFFFQYCMDRGKGNRNP